MGEHQCRGYKSRIHHSYSPNFTHKKISSMNRLKKEHNFHPFMVLLKNYPQGLVLGLGHM
jgi:hypothetical protein